MPGHREEAMWCILVFLPEQGSRQDPQRELTSAVSALRSETRPERAKGTSSGRVCGVNKPVIEWPGFPVELNGGDRGDGKTPQTLGRAVSTPMGQKVPPSFSLAPAETLHRRAA